MIDFSALAAPFPPEEVSWRLGSVSKEKMRGMALAYLDARAVADRLDDVCTPAGWQCRYSHTSAKTVCDIGIKCGEEWLWKADGAGDSDIEAEKGALSDAFKRAAVRWGVGRYLYTLDSPWVEIEEFGRSFRIRKGAYKDLDMILRRATQAILSGPQKQPDGLSQARDDIARMQNAGEQSITEQKTHARQAAEQFVTGALATFEHLNGVTLQEWFRAPHSPKGKSTNRDVVLRLEEQFPELHERLTAAAEEVRLRNGARLQ